jgi:hypothetical protein
MLISECYIRSIQYYEEIKYRCAPVSADPVSAVYRGSKKLRIKEIKG